MINAIPTPVKQSALDLLKKTGPDVTILDFSFIGGGCINNGGKLKTSAGTFFLKWNDAQQFPGMFEAEAKGLALLAAPNVIKIPTVAGFGSNGAYQFLLLDYIDSGQPSHNYWQQLGIQLASLHKNTQTHYGLDHDNYIGSLPQSNNKRTSCIEFFIEERLNPQLKLAQDQTKVVDSVFIKKFESLYRKLPSLLIEEKPALLHGDLWDGNLIADANGQPCLIDPAVYFGNREADLAMTQLFGGFSGEFYSSYHEAFPLQPGYQQRFDIYNLYPLLVHVNLFGESYLRQVESILKIIKL